MANTMSIPVKTKYGVGRIEVSIDTEINQVSVTYQAPDSDDIVDLVLVEARNKENLPIYCDPKNDEAQSLAIRVYGDPYDEDYTVPVDIAIDDIQKALVDPTKVPGSVKM